MKKEVFLAIFAGIAAGLILAFGVWRLTTSLKKNNTSSGDTHTTASPTPDVSFSITIAKPTNFDVVSSGTMVIEGLTRAGSIVIISTKSKDYKIEAEDDGSFEKEISLLGGLNTINVTSFNTNGQSATSKLTITYSSEFEKYLNSDETSTSSAVTVREKVQAKLENTLKKGVFYMGVITDIADNTVQLKSDSNGIQQIMVSEETTYVSDEDMAIGDFMVAMGFKNGNGVLDTKRILITDPPEENSNIAIWAKLTSVEKKEVSFINQQGETVLIDFPKTWIGPDISDLEVDMEVIVVGTLEENTLSLRSIFEL